MALGPAPSSACGTRVDLQLCFRPLTIVAPLGEDVLHNKVRKEGGDRDEREGNEDLRDDLEDIDALRGSRGADH